MKIDFVNKRLEYWEKVKRIIETPIEDGASLETIVFKKYLEEENVTKVANYINSLGYRKVNSNTGTAIKYIPKDVTMFLSNKNADVDKELKDLVQGISNKNRGKMRYK